MSQDILLEAKDVAKHFSGVYALRNGRLTLRAGSVHALCGSNGAGKTTFLNIVMGLLTADGGEIKCRGKSICFTSPSQAILSGIAIITQELSPIPHMTVAENIYLSRQPCQLRMFVNSKVLIRKAQDLLNDLGFDIDARARMCDLSLAKKQLTEIAKAISFNSSILIMDEPTSAIGEAETHILFNAIRKLKTKGVGIIYVSHRLTEIFEIADEYTVLRDGQFVATGAIKEIDRPSLVKMIVGAEVKAKNRETVSCTNKPLLTVEHYSRKNEFNNISLIAHAGEIVGLYGLMGAGRSEFLNCLFGLTKPQDGRLSIDGIPVAITNAKQALKNKMALLTEDRKSDGLVLSSSVGDNITYSSLRKISQMYFINNKAEQRMVKEAVNQLKIKTTSPRQPVASLSGGNQQKVVFARCLQTQPNILLCDEPTRGVDEGAKFEIYAFLNSYIARGNCVVVASSDIEEILLISDRILVFRRGKIVGELSRAEVTQHKLTQLAS
jgi:putative xylitol transport system ATP-binding protein